MDFQLTSEQRRLREKCGELAADFGTRAAAHDRDASHPVENYERLREEGFLALTVGKAAANETGLVGEPGMRVRAFKYPMRGNGL